MKKLNIVIISKHIINHAHEGKAHTWNDSDRKQHFLQHKGKHSHNKEVYTYGSKSTGRKVDFASVLTDITRRGALPEEVSIHIAEMTAMREIQKRKNMRWVIYTDSQSSMLAIENNRENCEAP